MPGTIWMLACREGEEDRARSAPRQAGFGEGWLWVPPPFCEIAQATGIWHRLNGRLGTLFDLFEQEVVRGSSVEEFALALHDEVARLRRSSRGGVVRAQIARRIAPLQREEWVEVALSDLEKWEQRICSLAREISLQGGGLVVGM